MFQMQGGHMAWYMHSLGTVGFLCLERSQAMYLRASSLRKVVTSLPAIPLLLLVAIIPGILSYGSWLLHCRHVHSFHSA